MEATCSSETSVGFERTTRRCIPDDRTPRNHRCENLKSYNDSEDALMALSCEFWGLLYNIRIDSVALFPNIFYFILYEYLLGYPQLR
jgi:hypothetical protein